MRLSRAGRPILEAWLGRQRWSVNPNLGRPTGDERIVNDLGNVCQPCGARVDPLDLIEPGGPFLPADMAAEAKIVCVPAEHLPFTANEAKVCEGHAGTA